MRESSRGRGTVGLETAGADARRDNRLRAHWAAADWRQALQRPIKASAPHVRVVGVEAGWRAEDDRVARGGAHPVTLAHSASIADGLLAVRPGDLTFEHVRALIDEVVRVSEDEIADAVRFLARHTKMVVEPSGATSVAGARRLALPGATGVHVAVVSGGNVEPARVRRSCSVGKGRHHASADQVTRDVAMLALRS